MEKNSVLFQIKSLEQLIIRDLFMKAIDSEVQVSFTQIRIIDYILENGGVVYQRELEHVFNLRRATISEVLKTMEKNNMIERMVSKEDTRVKEVRLSKKTKELFEKNRKKIIELEEIVTRGISESDLKKFSDVIVKMKENINNAY